MLFGADWYQALFKGLEDCIVASLHVESKTNNIANQHLPAAVRSPSEEKRAPVGSRPSSSSG